MTDISEVISKIRIKEGPIFEPYKGRAIVSAADTPIFDRKNKNKKLAHYNPNFDDKSAKELFYKMLNKKGLKVNEVAYENLRPEKGYVGMWDGSKIYVAKNSGKRPVTETEKIVIAGHEYGHEQGFDETGAVEFAERLFSDSGEFPYEPAFRRAKEVRKNARLN